MIRGQGQRLWVHVWLSEAGEPRWSRSRNKLTRMRIGNPKGCAASAVVLRRQCLHGNRGCPKNESEQPETCGASSAEGQTYFVLVQAEAVAKIES